MSLPLPKWHKKMKRRMFLKLCKDPNCQREFYGPAVAKYCEQHRDWSSRNKRSKRTRRKNSDKYVAGRDKVNVPVEVRVQEAVEVEFKCALEGCGAPFRVIIYPYKSRQKWIYVRPQYCEEHRNEYKRELWLRLRRKSGQVGQAA